MNFFLKQNNHVVLFYKKSVTRILCFNIRSTHFFFIYKYKGLICGGCGSKFRILRQTPERCKFCNRCLTKTNPCEKFPGCICKCAPEKREKPVENCEI